MKTFTFFFKHLAVLFLLLIVTTKLFAQRNFATTQASSPAGLLCLGCVVTEQANAVDGNLQSRSTLNVTVGVAASTYQELIFPGASKVAAGTQVAIKLGSGDNLLDLTALGSISIRPYNGSTPAGASVTAATLLTAASNNSQAEVVITPTQTYDRVRITLNGGLLGALSSLYVYDAFYYGPAPLACGIAFDELHGISAGLLNLGVDVGGVANPQNAIDGNFNTASTLNAGVGAVGAYAQQTLLFQTLSTIGDSVRLTVSIPQALVDAGVLSNIQVSTYNGNTSNNDAVAINGALLNVRLLDLTGGNRKFTITYAPTQTFDRVQLRLGGGIANVLSQIRLFEIERVIAKPIVRFNNAVTNNAQVCAGSTAALTVTAIPGTTVNWYTAATGGSPIFTGSNFTTPVLNATTTYYVGAMHAGCTDESARTAVVVTVNQIPAAPVIANNNITICPGATATFAATAVPNVTINWYATAIGGTSIFTGNNFTTPVLTTTTSYYAEAVAGGTCISPVRTQVTATVSPLPATPALIAGNATICAGDVAVLSIASPVAGQTYNWYTTATGGTPVFTGVNFTTPALTANTSYYAEAVNATGCPSSARVQGTVTISPKPADAVLTANNLTVAAGATATISVTNAQTGVTYNWYTSATASTPIFTGTTFTTPALFSTTTYYVAGTNATGCVSANRTAVTINVTINNNSPCVFANAQTSTANGICIGCSVDNGALATDADTTTASTIHVVAGLLGGYAEQSLQFQTPGFAGDMVKVVLQSPVNLADVGLLGSVSISLYNGATLVATYPLDNNLLTVRALGGTNRYSVLVPATGNYDRAIVRLNAGATGLLTSLQVYYAIQQFPVPVFANAAPEICKGSPAVLTVSNPANGTINWYATPTGGTSLFTGATFTTPNLNANTTYYVDYTRGTCTGSVRYPITVLVNDPPVKPVVNPASATIFAGQTTTFTAQAANGATVKWYVAATGGTAIFTGNTFTTPALSANTTYYAESSLGNCISVDRTPAPVTVTAITIPDVTVTPPTQAVNPGATATLTASSTTPGAVFNWYTTSTGGTSVFTGPTYTTPTNFNNTTYYAEASIPATGAVSATRAPGAVTINTLAVNPVPCDAAISQTNAVSGTLCVLCGISNENGSVDVDRNTFAQLNTPVGLLGGYSQQILRFANTGRVGDSVIVELGIPGSLASVGVLSQISLATYNGATFNNDRFNLDGSTISVTLLNGTTRFRIAFKATADFDRVEIRLNSGVAGVLSALNIYDAAQEVAAPVIAVASVTACQGTQATLTATVPAHVTVKWYTTATGGTPVFTGAVFNTPALNATTTYYAEASRTADGCTQITRTPVTVTVTPVPNAPVVTNPTATVCAGQPATFTAQAVAGVTFNWYTTPAGGTPVFTGAAFTTPALTQTTSYYVEAAGAGACGSSTRTQVTANVTSAPLVPQVAQNPTQTCSGTSAVLTATSTQPGVTFNWYTAATGGTPVFTGAQFTTPTLTANTSYFVEASSGTCVSATRAQADVVVNPAPVAPTLVVTPTGGQIQSGQTATITASSTTAGATFNWYTSASGGVPIFTGATFTTPVLTSNTTYYVESALATGCTSPTRTAVTIKVNPIFSTACDFGSTQTIDINGLCIGCTVTNPSNAADADTTTASQINVPLAALGAYAAQTLIFADGGLAGDTVTVKINVPANLATVGLLDQLQIASFNGATYNGDRINLNNSLIRIQLLSGGTTALVKFVPGAAFDRVEVRLNSTVASLLNSVSIFFASKQVSAPTLTANTVNICAGSTATFTVSNPKAGITYNWYATATGGVPITSGASFTTGALSATTTYYVEAVRTSNGCVNPNRVAATVNVTPLPVNPVLAANTATICAGDNFTLTVTNAAGATVRWYDAATNGTLLFTGPSFVVSPIATMSYFAEISNGTCGSAARTQATITVNPRPATPALASTNVQVCAGSAATLVVSTPEAGVNYNWYTAATGGTSVFTGASFTTPPITQNTTYYVEAANSTTNCTNNGGRVAVNISINNQIAVPTLSAANTTVCAGGSVTLSVTNPVAGVTYNWYTAATGGAPIFTGITYIATNLTANTSYFVEAASNGCTSATRAQTNVIVQPVPTAPQVQANAGGTSVCTGASATLSIANPQADLVYRWYDAATGGTLVYTGTVFNTPALTANTTYYVEAASAGNCNPSARTAVTVTVNPTPADPTLASATQSVCKGSSATLAVTSPVAGITYRWYDSPAQNNVLFTGATYVTGPVTATTNFYVAAFNATGCSSNNLAMVQVTVQNAPDAPVIANGSAVTACAGSQVTLNIANPQAGYTYNWYSAITGGAPIFTGVAFTTPALNSNISYYVEAISDGGCASATRTRVDITVQPAPATPTLSTTAVTINYNQTATISVSAPVAGVTYNWYNVGTGGTAIFTGTTFTTPNLTATTTYYVEAVSGTCTSPSRAQVTVTVTLATPPNIVVTPPTRTVASGQTTTFTASSSTPNATFDWYTTPTGGTPIFSGANFTTPPITGDVIYYAEATDPATGAKSTTRATGTVTLATPPNIVVTPPTRTVASGQITTFTASSTTPNATFDWYTTPTGGTPIFSGANFTTPPITGNVIYYAEATDPATGAKSTRATGTVTVTAATPPNVVVTPPVRAVTTGQTTTFTASSTTPNATFDWYTTPTGGTPIFSGANFTTPPITGDIIYYAEATDPVTGAKSTRATGTVTLATPPNIVVTPPTRTVAAGQTTTFTASSTTPNATFDWYTTPTGGTPIFSGANFTTPPITGNVIYYAEATDPATGAKSTRATGTVTVTAATPPNVVVTPPVRAVTTGQTTTFTASSTTPNATFDWYTTSTGGTPIFSGANFTTPPAFGNVIYYAEATDPVTGVKSATRATGTVTVTAANPPDVAVTPPTRAISANQSTTFTATSSTANAVFNWYTTPTGGTSIFTGANFTTPSLNANTIYYAEATDPVSGLKSVFRATGTVTINDDIVFVPNAFTPNGDGNNDVLFYYGSNIQRATFSVYDQWGELQFRSTSLNSGWDGTYKGRNQPVGVYVYYIEAVMNSGQTIKRKGTVTLLR
ncbi:gliding motility-associated C-terminal domain-containing protein [Mucilaginibacter glaciei]|uniref:Gliding motility-associated C-terminal domain-containing protein n=1 Tax=Mucilaginibacter glaciei TaxID=2772109 RepID=A0A926NSM6_9SPHI|nr:gliding motility-associated C-terminal domain-containing protein [Mucilaginibacter glaciei]MBD1395326.1 gliding motility-associated C-terminal domain-containing protein [Mucilaginibacter glaciei]